MIACLVEIDGIIDLQTIFS